MKTFTIQCRVHFQDADKESAIKQAILDCAKQLQSTAILIADARNKPEIVAYSEDFFAGRDDLDLSEEETITPSEGDDCDQTTG